MPVSDKHNKHTMKLIEWYIRYRYNPDFASPHNQNQKDLSCKFNINEFKLVLYTGRYATE